MELPKKLTDKVDITTAEQGKLDSLYYRRRKLDQAVRKYCKRNSIINSARIAKLGESHGFRLGGTEKPYYGR